MKSFNNKLLLFIVCNAFILCVSLNIDCSTTYIVPIFGETVGCTNDPIDNLNHPCFRFIAAILGNCEMQTARQLITIFDLRDNIIYTCPTDEENSPCTTGYSDQHKLILTKGRPYDIKGQLKETFSENQECNNNSMVVFIVGIPCLVMDSYPDMDELFGTGLNETKQYFTSMNLNVLIVLVKWDEITDDICPDEITHLKFSESSFFETQTMIIGVGAMKTICQPNDYYDQLQDTGYICSTTFTRYDPPDHSPTKLLTEAIAVAIVCGVVFLGLLVLFIAFWIRQIWRRWQESKIEAFADEHTGNVKNIIFGKYKDQWEVTPKELKVDESIVLGQGAFGKVYLGHLKKQRNKEWIEMDVAVKFTHDYSTESTRKEMIEEIGFMKALGSHENLLVMVGYVKSIENPVICTVYCSNGDLLGILKKHPLHFMSKEQCHDVEICLLLPDLLRIAIEISSGLEYLSLFNYVHRDVACRNILLTDTLQAKLADFGLCKKLEEHELCIIHKEGKFPIKYMPYESIKFGEFSFKTDVWSFGILMFEMFSGGQAPFKEIQIEDFVRHLNNDGKPEFPQETPQPLVKLLNDKIFQKYPSRRADFRELKQELTQFHSIVCNVLLAKGGDSQFRSFRSAKSFRKRV